MIYGVKYLLRRQLNVDCMQNRTDHGYRKKTFEIPVTVPVHHSHGITLFHAQLCKDVSQPANTTTKLRIGKAQLPSVNNFLLGSIHHRRLQQIFDKKRVRVSRLGFPDQIRH